ncbi:uncharacterized protein LOC121295792 [Polyodon spathula]|uniref:uncharacterized protein LOC121295792 n=1 Tax=Polyodon spathula TaxID=7913 RepID=UPI001B7F3643|nr:uncharacterized protein LOC121295792 [Polyodon spathula]
MDSFSMQTLHLACWVFLILTSQSMFDRGSVSASQEPIYLEKHEGQSVVLSCVTDHSEDRIEGFYLRRKWRAAMEVLFHSVEGSSKANSLYKDRFHIQGDLNTQWLNITLLNLQHNDTDLYICEFLYDMGSYEITKTKAYFIFVDDKGAREYCRCREISQSCSDYSTLLFAISGAVVLFLILITLLLCVKFTQRCCRPQPPAPMPIYEVMTGLPQRGTVDHFEGIESTHYASPVTKHTDLNLYSEVNPR